MRAVVFGADGLTFRLLGPLIERGDLPNFARLQCEGTMADFISAVPSLTPPAWMSLATGLKPAKHGIFDFWDFDLTSTGFKPIPATHRKGGKAIWNILSEYGKRVIVLNVPVTYPPEPVNGIMVSGLMTPSSLASFTFPHTFKDELYKVVPDYRIDLASEHTPLSHLTSDVLAMTEKRIQLQEHLLSEHEWDFAFLCYVGPDRIQHKLWDSITTLDHESTEYYRLLDDALGRVLNHLTPEDALFVVSDHGFVGANENFFINEYLHQRKLLQRGSFMQQSGSSLRKVGRKTAQKLHLLGLVRQARKAYQDVRNEMNANGRQPYLPTFKGLDSKNMNWHATHACVLSESSLGSGCADIFFSPHATREEVEELRQALENERHPETGKPLARAVYATDILGVGPFRPAEEHIMLIPNSGTTFHLATGQKKLWTKMREPIGIHEQEGVLYAWGANIRRGVRVNPLQIYDLVPTVLHTLGISADETFDGQVAREIFEAVNECEAIYGTSLVARKLSRIQESRQAASL